MEVYQSKFHSVGLFNLCSLRRLLKVSTKILLFFPRLNEIALEVNATGVGRESVNYGCWANTNI